MEERSAKNPMMRVMSLRDFRLLFAGSTTSLLGDQFALIATPWLVLQLTGDPLALGAVMALEGFPRAVFMLVGGAITDRLSPRIVMVTTDIIRFVLTAVMALVVFTGAVQIWMLYVFGLAFGLVTGFAIPAQNSIVPMLVAQQDLQAGNSIMMGVTQLMGFIGPTIAGVLIGGQSHSVEGVALAFAVDAFSFAASAACLWMIRTGSGVALGQAVSAGESLWDSILEGIRYIWSDRVLRVMFFVVMALNLLVVGPMLVGIPVLADQRLPEGALAVGLLMSAYAGGNLGGYLVAGSLRRPSGPALRVILIIFEAAFGLVVLLLGFISRTWMDFALLLILGLGNGYIAIILFTWMQTRTPKEMLGRMMSLLIFSSIGLVPISQAISGAVSKWDLTLLFVAAGGLVLLLTVWLAFQPALRVFSMTLAEDRPLNGTSPLVDSQPDSARTL